MPIIKCKCPRCQRRFINVGQHMITCPGCKLEAVAHKFEEPE